MTDLYPEPGFNDFIKVGGLTVGNRFLTSYVSTTSENHPQGACDLNGNRSGHRECVLGWLLGMGTFPSQMKQLVNLLPALGSVHAGLRWVKDFLEILWYWSSSLLLVAPEVAWVSNCYSQRVPGDSTHR